MAENSSLVGGEPSRRQINDRVIIIQILVMIFLCVNMLLIVIFFKKECFYMTARYILFAVTLMSDSFTLIMSDILFICSYFEVPMPVWLCIIISVEVLVYFTVTPVTLTVMTLECYTAICMPLRHGELCSTRNTIHCIFIIHGLSSVPCIVILSTFFASASLSFYKQYRLCSVEVFILHRWQDRIRSALYQIYFLILCFIIVFSYVKIMRAAKAASGEMKKSTWKGLRTVILHAFQLLLCLIQMWCPFIEAAVLQIDFRLFINVRFFNYITFILAPRCLSPLFYGLRDEVFFHALKHYVLCGLYKKQSLNIF